MSEITQVSSDEFQLDTSGMSKVADQCKQLAERMRSLKDDLVSAKDALLWTWVGEGRNEYEKQFRLLVQQFSDIIGDTWNMYEKLLSAEESYLQADTDAAKQLEGKTGRT